MTVKNGEEVITELTVNGNAAVVAEYVKETVKSKGGCGGSVGGLSVAMAALGVLAVALKKKH